MSNGVGQAQRIDDVRQGMAGVEVALCTAIDWSTNLATFNINGGEQRAPMFGMPPAIGREALLLRVGGQPYCLGPRARPSWAVVEAVPASGKVAVLDDSGTAYELPYADSLDLIVGDRVAIDWAAQVVYGEPASEVADDDTVGPGGGSGEQRTWTFTPIGSGSFLSGSSTAWTNRVYCSDSNVGGYFYGTQIGDTIPDTATILDVWVHLDAQQASGGAPTLGLHNQADVARPTVTDVVTIPAGTVDVHLPTGWGDLLKTGAKKGVGTASGGYHIYSPANVNNSGALTVRAQL